MPPETIAGRYDVVREVGRGGMGAVWLCRDRTLGREVAIKQVGGLPGESTPMLARALREARSSAALNHPNVVSIYDAIEDHGHVWLVMEYLPSRTLSQIIKEEGALDQRRAASITAQVADGLAAAHARGTVHRDVKPGNILVTADDVAKISDFGIARTLGDEQLTQTGLVSGTPLYFSPALARGAAPTPADDVWALGATLFAAVEGEPPWPAQENSIAMLMHIVNHQPPVPQRAGVLTEPIRRMMNVDPDARPSMADAAQALHAVAAGATDEEPTVILGGSAVGTEPTPAPDPHPTTVAAPVATPVAASRPTPTPVAPVPVDEPYGDRPDRSDRRRRAALLAALAVLVLALGGALLLGVLGDDDPTTTASDDPPSGATTGTSEPSGPGSPSEDGEPATDPATDPTTEDEVTTEPAPGTTEAAPAGGEPAEVVESYYALLPDDTRTAWDMLGPELQAEVGSYGDYRAFWNTIDSVSVDSTEATGEDTVLVGLTYNGDDSETRELTVVDGLIVDDGEPQ